MSMQPAASRLALDRPPSLTALAIERLRQAILAAEFELGEGLSEERLASYLGVSRTPVREALNALQLQGLVEIQPQRGSFVFFPSVDDVAQLCEFRMMMEARAIALCHARSKQQTLVRLREANAAMIGARERNEALAIAQADTDFHDTLFDLCGNRYLAEAYGLMSGRVATLRTHLLAPTTGIRKPAIDEHAEIIDAFASGDLLRAENTLSSHIFKMRSRFGVLLELLNGQVVAPDKSKRRRAASPAPRTPGVPESQKKTGPKARVS